MEVENHIFQGLRRDNHPINQRAEFLWDAHNIRITNRDDNTLLSITNERGPEQIKNITFQDDYVGHCLVGKYLIVFTAADDKPGDSDEGSTRCTIYRVEETDEGFKSVILFQTENWDKGWNPQHPIEAIGDYETELVQKVYWVDGVNQPRVINVAKPELKGDDFEGYIKDEFNFVREINLDGSVDVDKIYGNGEFPSGVIQYACTYYNKYAQESKMWYTTPLYYTSFSDRAGDGETKVANSFKITINNPDVNFDFIRVYSIQRTSINAEPTVKRVIDLPIKGDSVSFIDTGTIGDIVDPRQLLYIGGTELIAGCIAKKDNTLFLSNISIEQNKQQKKIEEIILNKLILKDYQVKTTTFKLKDIRTYYDYKPNLSQENTARFKTNEIYRLGIQVQITDGSWSEPIYIDDKPVTATYPWDDEPGFRSSMGVYIDLDTRKDLYNIGVKKLRTCVVFPDNFERNIICQGVLNPTVYSTRERESNSPFVASSWFFRAATDLNLETGLAYNGANIEYRHNMQLFSDKGNRGAEVQSSPSSIGINSENITDTSEKLSMYFVDENIVTLNSPDIEFDTFYANTAYDNTYVNIIGVTYLDAIAGDINIETSTPVISSTASGFNKRVIGYLTKSNLPINGGLVSGLFYEDGIAVNVADTNKDPKDTDPIEASKRGNVLWMIYPWQRIGSLNNDIPRAAEQGERTAVLSKKVISNLKFFSNNFSLLGDEIIFKNISTPVLFNSDQLSLKKLRLEYIDSEVTYLGNVDTLTSPDKDYSLFYSPNNFNDTPDNFESPRGYLNTEKAVSSPRESVRIKYKSSPHLVFSLGSTSNFINVLPRHQNLPNINGNTFNIPDWMIRNTSVHQNDIYHYDLDYYGWIGIFEDPLDGVLFGPKLRTQTSLDSVNYSDYGLFVNNKEIRYPEGIILKVIKNKTIIYPDIVGLLPDTTELDYNREGNNIYAKYIGEDKYYKIIKDDNTKYRLVLYVNPEESTSRGDKTFIFNQPIFNTIKTNSPYLLLAELVRDVPKETKFGGNSPEALKQNLWIPSSTPINIDLTKEEQIIPYIYGDTWYARYDCLKTYPYTPEDQNQIVEIGSFMCETRVNIDGRTDRNRGQISNLNMTPQNFNLINEVYSQKDNFFNYRILDEDYYKTDKFSHQVLWSTEKWAASDVDSWTNISLATPLDMDGSKGPVTKLVTLNDKLLCLQEKGFSQLMFNTRVQIPTSDNNPIEISNGYKMDGYRAIADIGCQNKWSVCTTLGGLYFIDDNTDTLWLYDGEKPINLSGQLGMKWWFTQNHSKEPWKPVGSYSVRTFYDPKYGDVYFVPGYGDALCFSEQLMQFTSQYSYGGTAAMVPLNNTFLSLRLDGTNTQLWENFKGEYNNFFGQYKDWDLSFISNARVENMPIFTKIFDTIELRIDHYNTEGLDNTCPINFIHVDNEYQDTKVVQDKLDMKKKFRVWRGLIPRNFGTRERIRNPWTKIKIGWIQDKDNPSTNRVHIHETSVKYSL